ncbi:MAG: VRR-NUC domain-containing protein [Oscillospiraceae bacterium]|nr:VRR-NUC domain-containing protein [Oscillospiraceae bacterium]
MEKDIVNKIIKYLKTLPQTFVWKEHGGMYGTAGIPDVICCHKGMFVAFEVKTDTGKATLLQEITLRKITEAGGMAQMVRSLDEVKAVMEGLDE